MRLRLGTRGSTLALTQSSQVADLLRGLGHDVELVTVRTRGDRERRSLMQVAGLGVFAAELRSALLAGDCDLAVHSLKDLPVAGVPGLVVAAVPPRQDCRDALCARDGLTLAQLPPGARVGTGSPRRVAQLRRLRPDVEFVDIRGNVDTRLSRIAPGDLDAVVLAVAGLARLGLEGRITDVLDLLPSPGQGALAVECRADDDRVRTILAGLDDAATRACTDAERAALGALGGGCAAPIGAHAQARGSDVCLRVGVYAVDGGQAREATVDGADPEEVGRRAAARLLADGAADVCDLDASRASRLGELHDDVDLWPERPTAPTVLLPRDRDAVAAELERAGMRVLAAPVLREVRLPAVGLPQADWVVVTSARAVAALEDLGWRNPDGARIAAVGPATAAALTAAGFSVDLVPQGQTTGAALADALPDGPGRAVVPGSALSAPTVPDRLRAKGWDVTTVPLYTMERVDSLPDEVRRAWQAGEVDAVVVTSGSVARAVDELLGWPAHLRVLAIGAPTAAVLADLGVAAAVATGVTPEALARSCRELLWKGQP